MGCRRYFVVDRLEDLFDEGGSRSSWRAHEHESFHLVSQLHVAIRMFWSRSRLPLNALIGSKQRVSPFCHRFNFWAWHRHWMGINPTQIFPFSSLNVAWCCCSRWGRRAWRRCRTIILLSWRCRWCWRMRTGGRTRSQDWNHDRNEVLRIALYSNPVFNEMWFSTVDPLIRTSFFIAELSDRQYCWRVFKDFQSRIYPILWHTPWPLHASALLYWLLWLSKDYTTSSRYLFQQNSCLVLLIICIDPPESANSRSSGLRVDAGRHLFSEGEKNVALFISFLIFYTLLVSLHAASRAPCSCHSVSSWDRSSKFWSVGATLMRFTLAYQSERRILVSNVCVTCNGFLEFYTLDWFPYVWALP